MEGYGHNSVGGIKSFFHAVAMMNVNVDVQDTLMVFQKLENGQDNVVDITEAGSFGLLGVVKSTGPVDGNIGGLLVQFDGRGHGSAPGELTELVKSIKHGAILAHVEPLHLFVVLAHVIGSDGAEETNVLVGMKFGHLLLSGLVRPVDFHLPVQSIVQQKIMGHAYPMGLHGMALAIVVIANVA